MESTTFRLRTDDETELYVYKWAGKAPTAVVQIAHGMGEHAGRYARLARALVDAGYDVYANDHRGHGRTAASETDLGVFAEKDGWNRLVGDCARLSKRIRDENSGVPLVLLGHSMGSAAAQHYMTEHAENVSAVVLSGSTSFDAMAGMIDVVRGEAERLGHRGKSELLDSATFGAFNGAFDPARTDFDWLSRDDAEVDAYVDDPLCGFTVSAQALLEMLEAAVAFSSPEQIARIPGTLPIHLISGELDPVHGGMTGLEALTQRYADAGLEKVTSKYYAGARHELFNETNRDEVTADLLAWLKKTL